MSLLARILPDNPVLTKEMRVRMRGSRAYWVLFVYLGILATLLWITYYGWLNQVRGAGFGGSEAAHMGSELFTYVVATQMFLVFFITPAITSGALTIEREQQTMDLLTLTRLPRRSIIAGKLGAAVLFTALLIVSSLPLISVCFMLGSVDPAMLISTYAEMLMGSLLIGSMGLLWSGIARTTAAAVFFTYGSLLVLLIVGLIGGGGVAAMSAMGGRGGGPLASAAADVTMVWFGSRFAGVGGLQGIGFDLLCGLTAFLLSAMAMARLEIVPARKAGVIRLITLLLITVQVFEFDRWWLDAWYNRAAQVVMVAVQPPVGMMIITAGLMMLAVPVFATGDLLPKEARNFGTYLLRGWTWAQLKRGKMASGIAYLVLLTALCICLYPISFMISGHRASIFSSARAAGWASQPLRGSDDDAGSAEVIQAGKPAVKPGAPAVVKRAPTPTYYGDFPQAAIVTLASVLGFSLFCMFLSLLIRNRWVAWILAYVLMFAWWLVPAISESMANHPDPASIWINVHYFNPVQAIQQICDPSGYSAVQWLAFGTTPVWQITTYLWLGIGALSLLASIPLAGREAGRNRPIQYEEMVADI